MTEPKPRAEAFTELITAAMAKGRHAPEDIADATREAVDWWNIPGDETRTPREQAGAIIAGLFGGEASAPSEPEEPAGPRVPAPNPAQGSGGYTVSDAQPTGRDLFAETVFQKSFGRRYPGGWHDPNDPRDTPAPSSYREGPATPKRK